MRKIYFTLLIMSVCSFASAQVVIENPAIGSVALKQKVLELNDQEVVNDSFPFTETVAVTSTVAIGEINETETYTQPGAETVWDLILIENWQGALEFSLENVEIPTSFTASNFTARLIGISGQPNTDSVSLSVDLFDMADSQEDFLIQDFDYDIAEGAVSINGDPFINGEFENGEIDVTAQLRADLFGDATDGVSTGFILQASGGTGLVKFPGIADAYIEMNLIGSDTGVDSDSDTNDVTVATDSDTATDTDTSDDTEDTPADTGSDSATTTDTASSATDTSTAGNAGTGDSDYWETEDDDSDGMGGSGGDGGSNVTCTCTAAGSTTAKTLWNLLF